MEKNFIITESNVAMVARDMASFIKTQVNDAHRTGVVLGMSGGLDCAVVARLCQLADVETLLVMMPDGDGMLAGDAMAHSHELIQKFNFDHETFDISGVTRGGIEAILNDYTLDKLPKENIRPRIRMTLLYTLAQQLGAFVIGTSNLNERLLGYFTKWGDGGSDLNPLGMLTKGEVRILARYLDVPDNIINKPPSAGLVPGQTDEDDLGFTYQEMDNFILNGSTGDVDTDSALAKRIQMSKHKNVPIPLYRG